jgi:hypothetical protein
MNYHIDQHRCLSYQAEYDTRLFCLLVIFLRLDPTSPAKILLASVSIIPEALSDLSRSRNDLIAENAFLRQQLIVFNRHVKQPQLTQGDQAGWVLLSRFTGFWSKPFISSNRRLSYVGIESCSLLLAVEIEEKAPD